MIFRLEAGEPQLVGAQVQLCRGGHAGGLTSYRGRLRLELHVQGIRRSGGCQLRVGRDTSGHDVVSFEVHFYVRVT